jgi:hypothetical protein
MYIGVVVDKWMIMALAVTVRKLKEMELCLGIKRTSRNVLGLCCLSSTARPEKWRMRGGRQTGYMQ